MSIKAESAARAPKSRGARPRIQATLAAEMFTIQLTPKRSVSMPK
jgi:hypothetical protein